MDEYVYLIILKEINLIYFLPKKSDLRSVPSHDGGI